MSPSIKSSSSSLRFPTISLMLFLQGNPLKIKFKSIASEGKKRKKWKWVNTVLELMYTTSLNTHTRTHTSPTQKMLNWWEGFPWPKIGGRRRKNSKSFPDSQLRALACHKTVFFFKQCSLLSLSGGLSQTRSHICLLIVPYHFLSTPTHCPTDRNRKCVWAGWKLSV